MDITIEFPRSLQGDPATGTANKTWCSVALATYNGSASTAGFGPVDGDTTQCFLQPLSPFGDLLDLGTGTSKEVSVEIRIYP